MTAALERGEWSAARPGRTLPPGKDPVPILQEAGWAPGPVWTGGKSRPHRDSIPDRPARSSVAIPTELPGPHSMTVIAVKTKDVCLKNRAELLLCYSLAAYRTPHMFSAKLKPGGRSHACASCPHKHAMRSEASLFET